MGINYALSYLKSLVMILAKYNGDQGKDLSRSLRRLIGKNEVEDKTPAEIVKTFESAGSL